MRILKKALMSTAVAIPLLFLPCNRADAFFRLAAEAAADAALLAQQIAQFFQDFDMDLKKWEDYADKFKELQRMAKIFDTGSQAYTTINSMSKTVKLITRCGRDAERYITYLEKNSTNFRIDKAYSIYQGYNRRTAALCTDFSNTLKNLSEYAKAMSKSSSPSVTPTEVLSSVNETLDQFTCVITDESDKTRSQLKELCLQTSIDESCKDNADFLEMNFY